MRITVLCEDRKADRSAPPRPRKGLRAYQLERHWRGEFGKQRQAFAQRYRRHEQGELVDQSLGDKTAGEADQIGNFPTARALFLPRALDKTCL
jgi:hypothetical protein